MRAPASSSGTPGPSSTSRAGVTGVIREPVDGGFGARLANGGAGLPVVVAGLQARIDRGRRRGIERLVSISWP